MRTGRASDDLVRIYVSRRASGRPVPGWEKAVYFLPPTPDGLPGWIGWTSITEAEAKSAPPDDLVRRRRTPGQRWCDWCGPNTSVSDDIELQAYFVTINDDEWPHLSIAVRRSQRQAVAAWRASGARLIAAATHDRRHLGSPTANLFQKRGTGTRSLLKLIVSDRATSGLKPEVARK